MGQNQSFDFLRISLIKGPHAWPLIMGTAFFGKKKTRENNPTLVTTLVLQLSVAWIQAVAKQAIKLKSLSYSFTLTKQIASYFLSPRYYLLTYTWLLNKPQE
jgi:hypothetical protein